jgi:hypothetical protein
MPQVTEFPLLAGEARSALAELVKLARDIPEGGLSFRELRTRLRAAKVWDHERPEVALRFLGVGGATITRSAFLDALAATSNDEEMYAAVAERLWDLNPLLVKTALELASQRAYHKDEIYKHLGSFAYRGRVPSRPALEAWLILALNTGLLRSVGVAVALGPRAELFAARAADLDIDEFLAEDQALPDPVIPSLDDVTGGDAAPAEVAAESTAQVTAQVGTPLPPALRHLLGATSLASPRGRGRPVPTGRFAGGFSDEVLAETRERVAAWWAEAKPAAQALTPADFGLDPEGWVEGADEVLYRIAVAAALAFRLDTDKAGVLAAYRALDAAGVLGDLYHGTVPETLPGAVDAKALMLASLAARRCAESPELARALDQKQTAAELFAALDAVLGRGLFRIELFWVLDMLGQLGVVRPDDLGELTVMPHRLVRDTLFRLGFVDSPYAPDAGALTAAARTAHRAAGAAGPADEVLASFAVAAGCAYDCPHRRTCEYACRERLE